MGKIQDTSKPAPGITNMEKVMPQNLTELHKSQIRHTPNVRGNGQPDRNDKGCKLTENPMIKTKSAPRLLEPSARPKTMAGSQSHNEQD
ncbi:hypothetical protein R1flu_018990 [Riccia fluitans]|uniref:Uncharacterized protein n=1 Tax=Riccia fluitans TaxID=41844 RepID=A0ABD1ZHL8_9MARC